MTILKWVLVLVGVLYVGGVAVVFFMQRSMLFPIPPVGRTAPAAAGLPEAEEQVLTTDDGEKVIVWHVPAKPGRPVILFFHGNGDFLAGRVSRFRNLISDGTGLVPRLCRIDGIAERGRPFEGWRGGLCFYSRALRSWPDRDLGVFARHRRRRGDRVRASGGKTDPGGALHVYGRRCRFLVAHRSCQPVDARSISFRPAHWPRDSAASHHAW